MSDRYEVERWVKVTKDKTVTKFTVFDNKLGKDVNLTWDTYADAHKYADHLNVPALRPYIVRAL